MSFETRTRGEWKERMKRGKRGMRKRERENRGGGGGVNASRSLRDRGLKPQMNGRRQTKQT